MPTPELPMRRPRALVVTPDFPPEPGGIQNLVHRIASALSDYETRVVAINDDGARAWDATSGIPTARAGRSDWPNRLNVFALNGAAVIEGMRFRPDVVLN